MSAGSWSPVFSSHKSSAVFQGLCPRAAERSEAVRRLCLSSNHVFSSSILIILKLMFSSGLLYYRVQMMLHEEQMCRMLFYRCLQECLTCGVLLFFCDARIKKQTSFYACFLASCEASLSRSALQKRILPPPGVLSVLISPLAALVLSCL